MGHIAMKMQPVQSLMTVKFCATVTMDFSAMDMMNAQVMYQYLIQLRLKILIRHSAQAGVVIEWLRNMAQIPMR